MIFKALTYCCAIVVCIKAQAYHYPPRKPHVVPFENGRYNGHHHQGKLYHHKPYENFAPHQVYPQEGYSNSFFKYDGYYNNLIHPQQQFHPQQHLHPYPQQQLHHPQPHLQHIHQPQHIHPQQLLPLHPHPQLQPHLHVHHQPQLHPQAQFVENQYYPKVVNKIVPADFGVAINVKSKYLKKVLKNHRKKSRNSKHKKNKKNAKTSKKTKASGGKHSSRTKEHHRHATDPHKSQEAPKKHPKKKHYNIPLAAYPYQQHAPLVTDYPYFHALANKPPFIGSPTEIPSEVLAAYNLQENRLALQRGNGLHNPNLVSFGSLQGNYQVQGLNQNLLDYAQKGGGEDKSVGNDGPNGQINQGRPQPIGNLNPVPSTEAYSYPQQTQSTSGSEDHTEISVQTPQPANKQSQHNNIVPSTSGKVNHSSHEKDAPKQHLQKNNSQTIEALSFLSNKTSHSHNTLNTKLTQELKNSQQTKSSNHFKQDYNFYNNKFSQELKNPTTTTTTISSIQYLHSHNSQPFKASETFDPPPTAFSKFSLATKSGNDLTTTQSQFIKDFVEKQKFKPSPEFNGPEPTAPLSHALNYQSGTESSQRLTNPVPSILSHVLHLQNKETTQAFQETSRPTSDTLSHQLHIQDKITTVEQPTPTSLSQYLEAHQDQDVKAFEAFKNSPNEELKNATATPAFKFTRTPIPVVIRPTPLLLFSEFERHANLSRRNVSSILLNHFLQSHHNQNAPKTHLHRVPAPTIVINLAKNQTANKTNFFSEAIPTPTISHIASSHTETFKPSLELKEQPQDALIRLVLDNEKNKAHLNANSTKLHLVHQNNSSRHFQPVFLTKLLQTAQHLGQNSTKDFQPVFSNNQPIRYVHQHDIQQNVSKEYRPSFFDTNLQNSQPNLQQHNLSTFQVQPVFVSRPTSFVEIHTPLQKIVRQEPVSFVAKPINLNIKPAHMAVVNKNNSIHFIKLIQVNTPATYTVGNELSHIVKATVNPSYIAQPTFIPAVSPHPVKPQMYTTEQKQFSTLYNAQILKQPKYTSVPKETVATKLSPFSQNQIHHNYNNFFPKTKSKYSASAYEIFDKNGIVHGDEKTKGFEVFKIVTLNANGKDSNNKNFKSSQQSYDDTFVNTNGWKPIVL